ncbi:MAG TPA: NAD(P)/FAD-dependent oxidoreductase, partial [Gammaproteobacteria bacterium]|nr:NAD(P)/FAD-dependent oxidoreductase [Gammaproteobacteria bacterium]
TATPDGTSDSFDVLILGAGAAGLQAAAVLTRHGRTVCILEARNRIGGRIFTCRESGLQVPIELGAEFIHGPAPLTRAALAKTRSSVADVGGTRWQHNREAPPNVRTAGRSDRLDPGDELFAELERGLAAAGRPREDMAFADYLAGPASRTLSDAARELARALAEGFDAVDTSRASTLALLDEWAGDSAAGGPTYRPLRGYVCLIDALYAAIDARYSRLLLEAPIERVGWERGAVTAEGHRYGRSLRVSAARAVVALPLGVLQRPPGEPGSVRFAPALNAKQQALAGLAEGPALKIVLRFREPFWEALESGRFHDGAFFHAPEAAFPTLWTALPVRAPILTAWAGGPKAARLRSAGTDIVQAALESVEAVFGVSPPHASSLEAAYVHDWQDDPFARGAYSYVTVGAGEARKSLAAPVEDTLFFAGEAADTEGGAATVEGALRTGMRAAHQVLGSLEPDRVRA